MVWGKLNNKTHKYRIIANTVKLLKKNLLVISTVKGQRGKAFSNTVIIYSRLISELISIIKEITSSKEFQKYLPGFNARFEWLVDFVNHGHNDILNTVSSFDAKNKQHFRHEVTYFLGYLEDYFFIIENN